MDRSAPGDDFFVPAGNDGTETSQQEDYYQRTISACVARLQRASEMLQARNPLEQDLSDFSGLHAIPHAATKSSNTTSTRIFRPVVLLTVSSECGHFSEGIASIKRVTCKARLQLVASGHP